METQDRRSYSQPPRDRRRTPLTSAEAARIHRRQVGDAGKLLSPSVHVRDAEAFICERGWSGSARDGWIAPDGECYGQLEEAFELALIAARHDRRELLGAREREAVRLLEWLAATADDAGDRGYSEGVRDRILAGELVTEDYLEQLRRATVRRPRDGRAARLEVVPAPPPRARRAEFRDEFGPPKDA